jgi:hypothetical protein
MYGKTHLFFNELEMNQCENFSHENDMVRRFQEICLRVCATYALMEVGGGARGVGEVARGARWPRYALLYTPPSTTRADCGR